MSSAAAPAAYADDFNATLVPISTMTAAGHAAKSLIAKRPYSVLRMPTQPIAARPSARNLTQTDMGPEAGAAPEDGYYDLHIARGPDDGRLAQLRRDLRQRETGIMDVYTRGNSGFRMSVGSSYRAKYSPPDTGPGASSGNAAKMRLPVGAVNLRDGYESYAPVAMAGYDTFVTDRMKIGVEGGMMIGKSAAMYADETVPKLVTESHVERNPVADIVMTYLF